MPSSLCEQLGTLFIYTQACFQSVDNSNSLDYEERQLHNAIIISGRETQGLARAPVLPFMWYVDLLVLAKTCEQELKIRAKAL